LVFKGIKSTAKPSHWPPAKYEFKEKKSLNRADVRHPTAVEVSVSVFVSVVSWKCSCRKTNEKRTKGLMRLRQIALDSVSSGAAKHRKPKNSEMPQRP